MKSTSSAPALALLSWWGGFFTGPVIGVVAYATAKEDPLTRSHGLAAALVWAAALAFWIPFTSWVIGVNGAEPIALVVALPFVMIWTIGFCVAGTLQAMRGRSLLGQQLQP